MSQRSYFGQLCIGIASSLLTLWVGQTAAYSCTYNGPAAPSPETRIYRHLPQGFSFNIPANYRAMGTSQGKVAFHDPNTFAFIQCEVQSNAFPELPLGTVLEVRPLPIGPNLRAQVGRARPWLSLYEPTYESISIGETEALLYHYTHKILKATIVNLAFITADGNSLVHLEAPAESPVIPLVQASLQL